MAGKCHSSFTERPLVNAVPFLRGCLIDINKNNSSLQSLQRAIMEPITYYYDQVNRHAIVVKPKQPLLNWINALYPDMAEDGSATTVYLVRERNGFQETEKWLKRNFKNIFENELNGRHTDENDWPQKRTYKLFTEWFDTEIHTTLEDIEESPIRKN